MFWSLYKSIFQDLVEGDEIDVHFSLKSPLPEGDEPELSWWKDGIRLTQNQFKNYIRKNDSRFQEDFEQFKTQFESSMSELEDKVDRKIWGLRTRGKLNFPGAVELQSNLLKKVGWKVPEYGVSFEDLTSTEPIYNAFGYRTGQLWCYD